jgi:hypothetical protein
MPRENVDPSHTHDERCRSGAGRENSNSIFDAWWTLSSLVVVIASTRAGAADAPPAGPSVTVGDGALTPPVVVVADGGSVVWTNRGTRRPEIVAAKSAFPAFSLERRWRAQRCLDPAGALPRTSSTARSAVRSLSSRQQAGRVRRHRSSDSGCNLSGSRVVFPPPETEIHHALARRVM